MSRPWSREYDIEVTLRIRVRHEGDHADDWDEVTPISCAIESTNGVRVWSGSGPNAPQLILYAWPSGKCSSTVREIVEQEKEDPPEPPTDQDLADAKANDDYDARNVGE